jgi:hypothetical protein
MAAANHFKNCLAKLRLPEKTATQLIRAAVFCQRRSAPFEALLRQILFPRTQNDSDQILDASFLRLAAKPTCVLTLKMYNSRVND